MALSNFDFLHQVYIHLGFESGRQTCPSGQESFAPFFMRSDCLYALKNNKCNLLLQFSSTDRNELDLLFEPRLANSIFSGTKVDLIVGKSDKTSEEVIRGLFDLTSCLVMYSIGGDLKMEFPTFTLANTSLL